MSNSTFSPIIDGHIDNMPEPQEHAIQTESESSPIIDDSGVPFNADEHAVDSDGNPKKTASGRWAKKRGRKAGTESRIGVNSISDAQNASGQISGQCVEAAQATVDTIYTLGQMFGGDEFAPVVKQDTATKQIVYDERQNGIHAFSRLYQEKGVADIPPGIAVLVWVTSYIGLRMATGQKTQTRTKLLWAWIRNKFTRQKPPQQVETGDKDSKASMQA